jgi:hypothetical protein
VTPVMLQARLGILGGGELFSSISFGVSFVIFSPHLLQLPSVDGGGGVPMMLHT